MKSHDRDLEHPSSDLRPFPCTAVGIAAVIRRFAVACNVDDIGQGSISLHFKAWHFFVLSISEGSLNLLETEPTANSLCLTSKQITWQ